MPPEQNFFTGTPARTETFQRFTPQQQALQNQGISQLMALLQGNSFQPIEQRARTQFAQQTVPGLAERFTALDGQRSSAFRGALGQAASGLEENLASLRSQHQLGQQNLLGNLSLQPSFEQAYIPREAGFVESAAPGVLQALAALLPILIGGGLGGPAGAAAGAGVGSGLQALLQYLRSR